MNNIPRKREGQTSTNPAKLYKSQEADVNKLTPQYSRYFALYGKLLVLDFRRITYRNPFANMPCLAHSPDAKREACPRSN